MIDTHAHLNFEDFSRDYEEVIARSQKGGMEAIINVGAQIETSGKAIEIAEKHNICFVSVGVHPIHTKDIEGWGEEKIVTQLSWLAQNKKVVAIGETGLDYYHLPQKRKEQGEAKEAQEKLFKIHLKLARKVKLPVILHCRDAYNEMLDILQKEEEVQRGVIHCFCGSREVAQQFLKLGFYLGFTGMITYPGNEYLAEVIKKVPLDKILAETDCPYLPPQEKRGERNEPLFVRYVIQYIAKIKGLKFEEAEEVTSKNAVKLFELR